MTIFNESDFVRHPRLGKGQVIDVFVDGGIRVSFAGHNVTFDPGGVSRIPDDDPIEHYDLSLSDDVRTLVDNYGQIASYMKYATEKMRETEQAWQEKLDAQAEELNYLRELLQNGQAELTDPLGFAKDVAAFNELLQQDDGLRTTLSGEPIVIPNELRTHPPVTK